MFLQKLWDIFLLHAIGLRPTQAAFRIFIHSYLTSSSTSSLGKTLFQGEWYTHTNLPSPPETKLSCGAKSAIHIISVVSYFSQTR